MTEEEFIKLVDDFVHGHLRHSENWKYKCFDMMAKKYRESNRMEICILFEPYKVELENCNAKNN